MRLPRILKIILNIYALGLAAILIWPVLQMVLTSVTSDIVFPPRYFYFGAWNNVIWPSFVATMGYSFKLALWSTVLLVAICLPAAYAMERRIFPGRALMSVIIFVPTIFPSVTYTSAIAVYVFMFLNSLRGSFPIIVVATAMAAIPLVVRSIQASLATTDPIYEEAAMVMGATPLHAFWRVTLPLIAPGLITAAMIAFTAGSTAFIAPQMLGATEQTATMYIYQDTGKTGFSPRVAIQAMVMQAVVLGIVQTLYFVFRKQFRGLFV
jgi:putative spermidine/putrescine transport system permease protein